MRKMLALPGGRCDDALGHTDSSAVRKPTSLSTEGLAPLPNVPARWAWVTAGLRPLRGAVPPWGPPGGSTHTSSACLDLCTPKQVPPRQAVVPRCTAPSHAVGVGWDEPQQVKGRVWPALSITAMGSRGRPQPGNPAHPALVRGAHVKTCGSLGSGFPSPSLSTPHAGPARHWKSARTLGRQSPLPPGLSLEPSVLVTLGLRSAQSARGHHPQGCSSGPCGRSPWGLLGDLTAPLATSHVSWS